MNVIKAALSGGSVQGAVTAGAVNMGAALPPGGEVGQVLTMGEDGAMWADSQAQNIEIGDGLKMDEEGRLAVDTADAAIEDNTKPITSAAVYTVVGNIEVLLGTI